MKVIALKETNLDACVKDAQNERIVITRNGKPVALVVGVEGLDTEQLELGSSSRFWELITQRRQQKTITREQLNKRLRKTTSPREAVQDGVAADQSSTRKKRSPRAGA